VSSVRGRRGTSSSRQPGRRTGVPSRLVELLLDAQQLVVLGDSLGTGRRARLDLPGVGGHRQVGDGGVLRLARAVRDDGAVARLPRHVDGVERFGDRTDLIQLHQQRVADLLRDPFLQDLRVGHENIVANQL